MDPAPEPTPNPEPNPEPTPNPEPVAVKPDWCDERFYNKETGEVRYEDIHKSWSSANDLINGKKKAPEEYALEFGEDVPAEYREGFDAEDELVKSLFEFAKESDLDQAGFNKLLGMFTGSEIEDIAAGKAHQEAEMKLLGEHAQRRISDINLWIDANLEEGHAKALKSGMTSAAAIEALEQLKSKSKAPEVPKGDDLGADDVASHAALKERLFAKDEHGNRLMQNPAYAQKWREDAAKANYRAA